MRTVEHGPGPRVFSHRPHTNIEVGHAPLAWLAQSGGRITQRSIKYIQFNLAAAAARYKSGAQAAIGEGDFEADLKLAWRVAK